VLTLIARPMLPMIAHNESWTRDESLFDEGPPKNYTSLVAFDVIGPSFFPTHPFSEWGPARLMSNFSNTSVNFTVSYFEFNCPSSPVYMPSVDGSWSSLLGTNSLQLNNSMLQRQADIGSGFFLDLNTGFNPQSFGQDMVFGSFYNSQVTLWSCLLYVTTRDISFTCSQLAEEPDTEAYLRCEVYHMGIASVSTSTPFSNSSLAANIFEHWPQVDPASLGMSSLTEQFLAQGANFTPSLVDLSKLDNYTFASRLTTIFNTYIQTPQSNGPEDPLPSDNLNSSNVLLDTFHNPLPFPPFVLVSCNWVWFGILSFASTFLIICASLSIWLSHSLSTPDLMGYVSTMVQHNPHISDTGNGPRSDNTLNGLERAKLLKRVRVQIRDVRSDGESGQFALTSDVKSLPKTGKGRKYF
jgi:hypothetical protein